MRRAALSDVALGVGVALLLAANLFVDARLVDVYECNDNVTCAPSTCYKMTVPSDTCYQLRGHGDTWDCGNVTKGTCFNITQYPLGSNCTGAPIGNRANYCDECKGQDPLDYVNMQRRKCHFGGDGVAVAAVSYHNCTGEHDSLACVGCDAVPAVSFALGHCVTYEGAQWMLQPSSNDCQLMKHANFHDTKCSDWWWGDRIVLDACNGGFLFRCPAAN